MKRQEFINLVCRRWCEAQGAVGFGIPGLSWDFGDYPHFRTKRGYGVTFHGGKPGCHMLFPPKILRASRYRADGVLRHEIGHVVDMLLPKKELNQWAASRGVALAHTPERRADDVARAVWQSPIRYDNDLVQSTRNGVWPRPEHLGL